MSEYSMCPPGNLFPSKENGFGNITIHDQLLTPGYGKNWCSVTELDFRHLTDAYLLARLTI